MFKKNRENLVEFFPTFIDKSCVSFSYLKKKQKKTLPSLEHHKAKTELCAKNQRFELKILYSIMSVFKNKNC